MCCHETGKAGLAILASCVIVEFIYGVVAICYGVLSFFVHDERSAIFKAIHAAVTAIAGYVSISNTRLSFCLYLYLSRYARVMHTSYKHTHKHTYTYDIDCGVV